jgi:hypothetical protein
MEEGRSPRPPSAEEKTKLLASMRQYAQEYVMNLPNFLCTEHIQQFEAARKAKRWHKGDSLTFKLIYNRGREDRTLELVNDKPITSHTAAWRTPLTTEGEFGLLLNSVFGVQTAASFVWNRWEPLQDRWVAVFDYSVDQERSTLKLSLSDVAHAIVPYHGSVYADPANGSIRRITSSASDIPASIQTKSIATTIDYQEVPIAGRTYLLPVQAIVSLATRTHQMQNEMRFVNYRKFETDSTVTYTPAAEGAHTPEPAAQSSGPPQTR